MSISDDQIRLRHMRDAARQALQFVEGASRASLDEDVKLVFALVRAVEIIGEAAARISDKFRLEHPNIPWPEIISIRNRLIHAYFEVNLDIVWHTVIEDLPALIQNLDKLLPDDD